MLIILFTQFRIFVRSFSIRRNFVTSLNGIASFADVMTFRAKSGRERLGPRLSIDYNYTHDSGIKCSTFKTKAMQRHKTRSEISFLCVKQKAHPVCLRVGSKIIRLLSSVLTNTSFCFPYQRHLRSSQLVPWSSSQVEETFLSCQSFPKDSRLQYFWIYSAESIRLAVYGKRRHYSPGPTDQLHSMDK